MKPLITIAKREVFVFLATPIGWAILTLWLLWHGATFAILVYSTASNAIGSSGASADNPISMFYGGTTLCYLALLIFVPLMTMRLFAEEWKSGTAETLLTAPISTSSLILGKYAGALAIWAIMWLPTGLYTWVIRSFVVVDFGKLGAIAVGLFLLGALYIAIGLWMSIIARTPLLAALYSFLVLALLFLFGLLGFFASDDFWREVFDYGSVWRHMEGFARGQVDTRPFVFDLSLAIFALIMANQGLQNKRSAQ